MITRKSTYTILAAFVILAFVAGCAGGAVQTAAPTAEIVNPPVLKATDTKAAVAAPTDTTAPTKAAEATATSAPAQEEAPSFSTA